MTQLTPAQYKEWLTESLKNYKGEIEYPGLVDAAKMFENVTNTQWISVEERLPESGKEVLIWCVDKYDKNLGGVTTGWYSGTYGEKHHFNIYIRFLGLSDDFISDEKIQVIVTHWQPLPEPPR